MIQIWRRMVGAANNPAITYRIHAWMSLVWVLLLFPSWYLWRDSLFWVIAVSIYANFVSHWGAWQAVLAQMVAARAEAQATRAAELVAERELKSDLVRDETLRRIEAAVTRDR